MESQEPTSDEGQLPPAAREPLWMLAVGCALFAAFLFFSWYRMSARELETYPSALEARSSTLITAYLLQQALRNTPLGLLGRETVPMLAVRAAESWREAGRTGTDPAYTAKTSLNAAALYGVAAQTNIAQQAYYLARARTALDDAAAKDPSQAAIYHQIQRLYREPPSPAPLSARAEALSREISGGDLIRARQAGVARGTTAAIAALQSAATRGLRVLLILLGVEAVLGVVVLAVIIIALLTWRRIAAAFAAAATPEREPPDWGVGAALIVISAVYLLASFLNQTIGFIFTGGHAAGNDLRLTLISSSLATIISTVVIVSLFLLLLGHHPWEWRLFGWHWRPRAMAYGAFTLLMSVPVIGIGLLISAVIFRGRVETHPLIPMLQTTRDPWMILLLAAMAVVMAPLVEETLFRGILFRACRRSLPFWWAAPASGIIFAVGHGQLVAIIPIALLGMTFAFLTRRTGSLWASAAAHAIFNGYSTLMALLIAWTMR